jgi:hypothetical protein
MIQAISSGAGKKENQCQQYKQERMLVVIPDDPIAQEKCYITHRSDGKQ